MLIGHQTVWKELNEAADLGRLHHAHLFLGPKHIGKTHLAMEFAKKLLAIPADSKALEADLIAFLDDGENLPIERMRGMIERSSQSFSSPYLIVILEDLSRLRLEAMNALLKTLEEPPSENILFFLTAHRDGDVLETIRSRCQVRRLSSLPDSELEHLLEGEVHASDLLRFAAGRPGKLLRLKENPEYFAAHQDLEMKVLAFFKNPRIHNALELSREAEKHEYREELLDLALALGRRCFKEAQWSLASALSAHEACQEDLRRNINAKLSLDQLFIQYAYALADSSHS